MKISVISDTHNKHHDLNLVESDILIVCGDFTNSSGKGIDLYNFDNWLGDIKHKFRSILVIKGNHEHNCYINNLHLTNAYEMDGDYFEMDGVVFYGATYSDNFGVKEIIKNSFYPKIDVLITHYPPYGILDKWGHFNRGGSKKLLKDLLDLDPDFRPKHHVFGHIHEMSMKTIKKYGVKFINASVCDPSYNLAKKEPIIIEINK